MSDRTFHNVTIIGAGVSGMTCALYLSRANIDVCLVGDYCTTPLLASPSIRNYPGIKDISGAGYLINLHDQVSERGVSIIEGTAMAPVRNGDKWVVLTDAGNIIDTNIVVIATGSSARLLNLEKEEEFIGKGVSTCAYCDGPIYEGKNVCVIGSGTLAIEEAMYLSKICKRVTVLCRKSQFSTCLYTPDQLSKYPNVAVVFDAPVKRINVLENRVTVVLDGNLTRIMPFDGVFYAIGSLPNTRFLDGSFPIDENGYITLTDELSAKYGMYACGDVNAHNKNKQVVTAAADGCNTALKILKDLRNR